LRIYGEAATFEGAGLSCTECLQKQSVFLAPMYLSTASSVLEKSETPMPNCEPRNPNVLPLDSIGGMHVQQDREQQKQQQQDREQQKQEQQVHELRREPSPADLQTRQGTQWESGRGDGVEEGEGVELAEKDKVEREGRGGGWGRGSTGSLLPEMLAQHGSWGRSDVRGGNGDVTQNGDETREKKHVGFS
jgi:hypothetical protein